MPPFSAGGRPPSRDENDESNLYIGYLPNNISEEELQRLFEPFGRIEETKVIKDRATGLSKGFGFVKFSDAREAKEVGKPKFCRILVCGAFEQVADWVPQLRSVSRFVVAFFLSLVKEQFGLTLSRFCA